MCAPGRRLPSAPVPGYEIQAELGRGAVGVVYKARQIGLNRIVALKMILAGGHASPTTLGRFRAEAEAVASLQHGNIVQVYEIGDCNGLPFFSLEYCAGGSLAEPARNAGRSGTRSPHAREARPSDALCSRLQSRAPRSEAGQHLAPSQRRFGAQRKHRSRQSRSILNP